MTPDEVEFLARSDAVARRRVAVIYIRGSPVDVTSHANGEQQGDESDAASVSTEAVDCGEVAVVPVLPR